LALPVWLLLVAAATPDKAVVSLRSYRSFARNSLGLPDTGTGSSLRSAITRVLAKLAHRQLIAVEETPRGRIVIQLRALDGSGDPYTMPRASETKVVRVMTGPLFANHWHQRLTAVELAGLLIALTEESWQYKKFGPHQWEKSRDAIARDYGIAASTWSKAKKGLCAAGLLEWDLPELGVFSQPDRVPADRYTVHSETLELEATAAPSYVNVSTPRTVTVPTTGAKLRLYRQTRVEVSKPANNVVPIYRPKADG
jgi:hypothetical protein